MADDLSNLSELEPAATDPVASGDDEIRKTRLHVKNWADVEHHTTGEHEFPVGPAEPAAGKSGRLFINTTLHGVLKRDTGSAWEFIRTMGNAEHAFVSASAALTNTFATKIALFISVPAGARVMVLAQCQVTVTTPGSTNLVVHRILYDGGTTAPSQLIDTILTSGSLFMWTTIEAPSIGADKIVSYDVRRGDGAMIGTTSNHTLEAFLV